MLWCSWFLYLHGFHEPSTRRDTCLCKNVNFFVHVSYGFEAIHLKVNIMLLMANS